MKPYVIGKSSYLREVELDDAEFIYSLRTNLNKSKHLSITSGNVGDQLAYIERYKKSTTDYYFIICQSDSKRIGTVRIYDVQDISFCWGSWILSDGAPKFAAIESVLMLYDFAFYSLHFKKSHFDVRKGNLSVISFHKRFGAKIVGEDELNLYFEYGLASYIEARSNYSRYLK